MDWKNRIYCNDITHSKLGEKVELTGWIDTVRDHGHLLFFHLRDISGIAQIVVNEDNKACFETANQLRSEFVVSITGTLSERSEETKNPHIPTGNVEVEVDSLTILNKSETPPFMVTEKDAFDESKKESFNVDEDIRLTYRYIDLRRDSMKDNIIKRYELIKAIRKTLDDHKFIEIETPVLTKSTPEGARDYLVPSRHHQEKFYALPQSPQLFKQLLMVSGFERYFQIVKCFRDEDLRPNRQPEFTQMDLEASFIDEEFIYSLIENLIVNMYNVVGKEIQTPFPRMTFAESMDKYGNDHPDCRFDMNLINVTEDLRGVNYKIFNSIIANGGLIKGMNIKGQSENLSKNVLQNEWALKLIPKMGAKGMTWMRVVGDQLESNIVQFFTQEEQDRIKAKLNAEDGDILVFIADTNHNLVNEVFVADYLNLIDQDKTCPVWVTDFPLFEKQNGELTSLHHPFTQPNEPISASMSKEEILKVNARAYDIVINGEEVGGGSIRIHDTNMQHEIFQLLGLSDEEIHEKFGFFVNALKYGAPPHGGLALGIDRLVAMILGTNSIREVIAFPKNRVAYCPLTEAPSYVSQEQLQELSLRVEAPVV